MKRAIVIVLDGCGAGAAPDCELFGDSRRDNTLLNVWNTAGTIEAPNLIAVGFFAGSGVSAHVGRTGFGVQYGRLLPKSMGRTPLRGIGR